ncbi:pollen-specific leucine-rich repeat extensin-like protein 1 [Triticum aestivum]|uniref:pollen-specific leucine-rich repeat extensin-like protein 1 n=1 Tax=Triticum aestivum TaxID=4565 RepID=UPI001D02092E|nr:pollen-specific leucine-rich repeat extensin-like protein 1 [Triticum aestivum]
MPAPFTASASPATSSAASPRHAPPPPPPIPPHRFLRPLPSVVALPPTIYSPSQLMCVTRRSNPNLSSRNSMPSAAGEPPTISTPTLPSHHTSVDIVPSPPSSSSLIQHRHDSSSLQVHLPLHTQPPCPSGITPLLSALKGHRGRSLLPHPFLRLSTAVTTLLRGGVSLKVAVHRRRSSSMVSATSRKDIAAVSLQASTDQRGMSARG